MRHASSTRLSGSSSLRTILVVIALVLAASAAAQTHGVSIFKSCESPKNRCGTDADCATGCCTTSGDDNQLSCTIRFENVDTFEDTWEVHQAFDVIKPGTAEATRVPASGNLPIVGTSGAVLCSSGNTLPCILAPGGSVTFQSSGYVIQQSDPNPLPDQANVVAHDQCNATGTTGCSTVLNTVAFTGLTEIVSGCSTCPPTPTPTATVTPTPNAPGPPITPGPPVLPKTATRTPKPTKTPKP